ncbi:hypothetical protein BDU57DRAFT_513786 [Ampelomyces quisqualis]|uniref:Uncharacterized protein n=1 Tax=Ampelomyces quisqualis TaxID=50730 RepID=A0A6A5QU87_AMPQU|nr:hypothetical protein BDU57DRAFT_513786 [Ampelomyces quisqualis]
MLLDILTNISSVPQERITQLVHEALKYCLSACEIAFRASFHRLSRSILILHLSQRPQRPMHYLLRR